MAMSEWLKTLYGKYAQKPQMKVANYIAEGKPYSTVWPDVLVQVKFAVVHMDQICL